MTSRVLAVPLTVAALVLILAVASLAVGQVMLPLGRVLNGLLDPNALDARIVTGLRLPRVLAAVCAGAALGVAGLTMQTLFRSPLADPWSLGLTAGGQLGAALVVTATGFIGPSAMAFVGALSGVSLAAAAALGVCAAALLMVAIANRVGAVTLLVFGLMLNFLVQGVISVALHFANRSQGAVFSSWDDGTFAVVTWSDFPVLLPLTAAGVAMTVFLAKPLTALLLGETYAASLGVDVGRLRRWALVATVLLASPIVAYCGPVLFLGLIVPHLARGWLRTADILRLLPTTALIGAALALGADFVVHLPWQQHFLHLNAVLGVLGAPVVMTLLLRPGVLRLAAAS